MIDVVNLSAKQGNITVFSELDLHLGQGEVISLLGPNGCGKTTLLRTMMGLHPNTSGMIQIEGANIVDLPPKVLARKISYVPQYHRLAFGYSVLDMVLMGVMAGYSEWARPTNAQKAMAEAALVELNIAHLSQRPYTELSGGQRQLVLIARALAQNTPYVFLDEPTNGLDYGNQLKLLDKIKNLSTEHRCILMTTHHPEHAMMIANRVITMQQGRLTQDGAPASVLTSQTLTELYDLAPEQAQDLWLQKLTPSSFKVVKTA
ncbi:MAG: ABC transporter ATP-binding protein [Thiotrichales bacterium]|nr:ABC transporter ATP-binding protein [Thiotrichales bacterium]